MYCFRYTYCLVSCFRKKKLPNVMYQCEKSVREGAKDYFEPAIELIKITKVGFFCYLVVWKVSGKVLREEGE